MKNMKSAVYISAIMAIAAMCGLISASDARGEEPVNEDTIGMATHINILNPDDVEATDTLRRELKFDNSEDALRYMEKSENWDKYSKGILPKMAMTNLDYASKLLNNTHDGFIVVDKGRMKLIRFDRYGEPVATYGMACGKNYGTKHKRSDCRTPEGFFAVKRVQNSTDWKYVDDDGNVSQKTGEFGPRFIRLDIPGISSIGIHGTCAPWSIGGRRSHGCIRLKNENIMELVDMVEPGMPVIVSPGTKDQKINAEEGYNIPRISTIVDSNYASL